ncbi:hypothetical protein NECAME_07004 [Necator americanus]|uniref:Uncharacterized protein n=1 Tax=Necator americanus TaxID=51031 RepID=W2TQX4_NECAM|nr:hypothetical protein NECAME_07004 [Necator americanus]ETN84183.1 hypothetical protein NECAME_07004 [Necator americanus]
MAKNSADLISQLDAVDGDYERYLSMVTSEIGRRKHGRSLVVLLFSEREVNSTLVETWKKLAANGKAHVFRVGNAKTTNELLSGDPEEKSFEGLIACSGAEGDPLEIRRRPAITSTLTSSRRPQIQFSKTTPRPTTPRPTTIPGPKLRPVFRRKDKELGQFETAPSIKSAEASRDIISKPLFTTPKAKSFARSLNEADIGSQSKIAATSSVLSPTRTPTSFRTFNQS